MKKLSELSLSDLVALETDLKSKHIVAHDNKNGKLCNLLASKRLAVQAEVNKRIANIDFEL